MIRYMDKGTRVERGNMIDRICQFEDTHPHAFMAISVVVALPVSVTIVVGVWLALWIGVHG